MKLEEAIVSLEYMSIVEVVRIDRRRKDAIKLGIEASKWYQEQRERRGATKTMWLPGETKE